MKRLRHIVLCLVLPVLCVSWCAGCGKGSYSARMAQALEEARRNNYREVLALASGLAESDPGDPNAWVLKSIAAERSGQAPLALQSALRGAELCPGSFAVQYTAGRLLVQAVPARDREAVTYLERAYALRRDDSRSLSLLTQCLARLNDRRVENYYAILEAIAPAAAKSTEIASSLGVYRMRNGKLREGVALLNNAYRGATGNPLVVLNLARALDRYTTGNTATAVALYRQYLELTRLNPEAAGVRTEIEARVRELTR